MNSEKLNKIISKLSELDNRLTKLEDKVDTTKDKADLLGELLQDINEKKQMKQALEELVRLSEEMGLYDQDHKEVPKMMGE